MESSSDHHLDDNNVTETNQQQGIDIRQALSILSARSEPSESHRDGCACCHHGSQVPESAKTMGQTIDLFAPTKSEKEDHDDVKRLEQERKERLERIRVELNTMTDKDLLQAVLKVQEDRVAAYREYERYVSCNTGVLS